ncbi:hypothetical protein ACO0QE_002233 [Hanseniaspora vineae]
MSLGPPRIHRQQPYHPALIHREKLSFTETTLKPYTTDLMAHYHYLNHYDLPDPHMLDMQPEISTSFTDTSLRSQHLDFIINLHSFLQLKQETLYLTVLLHDKYCSKRIVYKKHYLLVMLSSLWIASKYVDKKSRIPNLKELCYYANNANLVLDHKSIEYDNSMFVQMEQHICTTLNWEIGTGISQEEVLQIIFSNISNILSVCNSSSETRDPRNLNTMRDINNIGNSNSIENMITFSSTHYSSHDILKLYQISSFLCEYSLYFKNFMFFNKNIVSCVSVLLASKIYNMDCDFNYAWMCIPNTPSPATTNLETVLLDPFFQSETDLNELRKCCHCFLNEIFNIKHTEKAKILFKKYKLINIMDLLHSFIEKNYNAYLKLGFLSEKLAIVQTHQQNMTDFSSSSSSSFSPASPSSTTELNQNHLNLQIISITDYFMNIPAFLYQNEKWSASLISDLAHTTQMDTVMDYQNHYSQDHNTPRTNDSPNQHSTTSSVFEYSSAISSASAASSAVSSAGSSSQKAQTPMTPMSTMFMMKTLAHHHQRSETMNARTSGAP